MQTQKTEKQIQKLDARQEALVQRKTLLAADAERIRGKMVQAEQRIVSLKADDARVADEMKTVESEISTYEPKKAELLVLLEAAKAADAVEKARLAAAVAARKALTHSTTEAAAPAPA